MAGAKGTMKIYTYREETQKHLWLDVPNEWTMDDVNFFLKGKPHLEIKDRQKPIVEEKKPEPIKEVANPAFEDYKEFVEAGSPEPTTTVAIEPVKVPEPVNASPESEPEETKTKERPAGLPCCPYHPNYMGFRIRRSALECEGCQEVYKACKALGLKEVRIAKGPRLPRNINI